jgi:hypothetical protein
VGNKIKLTALAPLHMHPLQELNLYLVGWNSSNVVYMCATLPSLKTLRLCRSEWNMHSWRLFFHATLTDTTLPRLPNLHTLHLDAEKTSLDEFPNHALPDCALTELLRPPVPAALATSKVRTCTYKAHHLYAVCHMFLTPIKPTSKLSSIVVSGVVSPTRQLQVQQWTALGPRNSLGLLISLSIGETWFVER